MELEKCPYCSGHPKITRVGDDKQLFATICSECHKTPVNYNEARLSETGAGIIWNIRARELMIKEDISGGNY